VLLARTGMRRSELTGLTRLTSTAGYRGPRQLGSNSMIAIVFRPAEPVMTMADGRAGVEAEHATFNTGVAHQARIYDYLLGGKDNFAADRQAGEAMIQAYPTMVELVPANRAFLRRAAGHDPARHRRRR
jgi:hypothetical protein